MEEKLILDASKVLWHKERIEEWKRGEDSANYNRLCPDNKM